MINIDDQWNHHIQSINGTPMNNGLIENGDLITSKYTFPSDIWMIKPTWEVIIKIFSILPIFTIGTLANGSLIHVILAAKSLQTTTNLLIANMAIADLGTCLLCPWMFLCIDLFQNYILGTVGCHLDGFALHALTLVAIFSLSAVSYDRLSAIVFNCSGKLTKRTTYILLVIIWILGLGVALPLAKYRNYHERQWKGYLETYCTEDTVLVYPYWHVFAGLSVWAPLIVMAVCYSTILVKLDQYESQALKSKHPIMIRYKSRVARTLALVVLSFIICRVPFTALIIKRAHLHHQPPKSGRAESMYLLWYISKYLVLVNAAINPFLYGCSSSALRKELALRPATSWLVRTKKSKSQKHACDPIYPFKRSNEFKPRSPCIRIKHNCRNDVPNISSKIVAVNLNPMI